MHFGILMKLMNQFLLRNGDPQFQSLRMDQTQSRNPARNREREGPRVACKPECVLHFLREYYADIGKILDDPACNIPKDFFRLRSVAEEGSHDVKKVRDHRSLFALGNFSSNEAMKFVGHVFRWDYNQDIVSRNNENFRLQDADVTDFRGPIQ